MLNKNSEKVTKRAPKIEQLNRSSQAIIASTMQLLEEIGYRSLTINKISQHSGVARTTIYRRWGSIQEIVIYSVKESESLSEHVPDTGNLRTDLVAVYERLATKLEQSSFGRILPSLIEAAAYDTEFHSMLLNLMRPKRLEAVAIVEKAVERSEIKSDINISWLLDSITGPLYFRLLVKRAPLLEENYIEFLVDSVLNYVLKD
ncbi:MAG: TetR/AcrR family transcriptional regulator [Paraglaciecola sp.]|nr:TetR/AcrR family transcriptional regulator [Paraglaciecola sp.]